MMPKLKDRLRTLKEFLHGSGELEGRSFGDGTRPAFWWHKHLSDIDLAITRIAVLEAEIERLKSQTEIKH